MLQGILSVSHHGNIVDGYAILRSHIYQGIYLFVLVGYRIKVCKSNMGSKKELVMLNGHNCGMWAQDMETLLKS